MSFLSPWMLFGVAAVSVPIAIHFFFRSRYRTVPWAAMKFLLTSVEETSRRLKFQELLLLVVRCLVLALLALAMARPISQASRGGGRGDAVDAVFVIDSSYSMTASDGAPSRFERAKQAANDILDALPPHSTVQLIAGSNRAALLGPRSPSNLEDARALIQNLTPTSLSTDLYPAIREARAVLERGQLPNRELVVFSDLDKLGWDREASGLVSEFKAIHEKAGVTLVRCGTRTPKNAAIVGITPQAGVSRPGDRVGFVVLVRNTGTEDLRDVVVSLTADPTSSDDKSRRETQTVPVLKAGETRGVPMSARFDKAGARVLSARIEHDDVPGDNRFDQVVPIRETVNVLVVNGGGDRDVTKSSTFFLNHALQPVKELDRSRYYLQLREVEPRLASPALLPKTDLVFLVNVAVSPETDDAAPTRRSSVPPDFLRELSSWVRQGRGLVIIPGDHARADDYNRGLGDLLPAPIVGVREHDADKPLLMDRKTFSLPAFLRVKEDRYFADFNDLGSRKTLELKDAGSNENVVLRFANGSPALVRRTIDEGEVFLLATAFEPSWSDVQIGPTFLPFVQTLVAHLLHEQSHEMNAVAGQSITWTPRDPDVRSYDLKTPAGNLIRLGLPEVKDKRQTLALPDLDIAGIYRIIPTGGGQLAEATGERTTPIAVVPDLIESQNFDPLSDEQIDRRLGFSPVHLIAGGELSSSTSERFRHEWTLWLLAAVLILALLESWLAWLCGRAW